MFKIWEKISELNTRTAAFRRKTIRTLGFNVVDCAIVGFFDVLVVVGFGFGFCDDHCDCVAIGFGVVNLVVVVVDELAVGFGCNMVVYSEQKTTTATHLVINSRNSREKEMKKIMKRQQFSFSRVAFLTLAIIRRNKRQKRLAHNWLPEENNYSEWNSR